MPCDTEYDYANMDIFNDVLNEINTISQNSNVNHIICAGDFNTDMSRAKSLHTKRLLSFVEDEYFLMLDRLPCYQVDYTFESKANSSRSILDHFIVSQNMYNCVISVKCDHSVDNASDHEPISISLDIPVESLQRDVLIEDKILWSNANVSDIECYKQQLDTALLAYHVPVEAVYCNEYKCDKSEHRVMLQTYHDKLIDVCLSASRCIPTKKCGKIQKKRGNTRLE